MGRFHRHDDGTEHTHDDVDAVPGIRPGDAADVGDHSGYRTGLERVEVLERIFGENDAAAARNRSALDAAGVVGVNVMSSPGAGKTALLARTLPAQAVARDA